MSDKNSQIAARQKHIDSYRAEMALLEQLPEGLDIENVYRSSGDWCLVLNGDVFNAIAALPPLAIEIRGDNWGEPQPNKLAHFAADGDICYPVWREAGKNRASWFARLPSGEELRVSLESPTVDLLCPPKGYELLTGHHRTYFKRIPLMVDSTPRTLSPAELYAMNWRAFEDEEGYNARQASLAAAVKAAAARNETLTAADLPSVPPATMGIAGEHLVILGGPVRLGSDDTYTGKLPALVRMGGFWGAFTPAAAERLLAYANKVCLPLQELEDQFCKETLEKAKVLATQFIEEYVPSQRCKANPKVIAAWVSARLGATVSITKRESQFAGATRDVLVTQHWISFGGYHEGWSYEIPGTFDANGFDWEYPPFVEYEEAGPLFPEPTSAV